MKIWRSLLIVSAAQFVMVIDTSVMNVSISQLVVDFDTDVTTIQSIITLYSLVMATCMITGGKIGDIIGRRRAFAVGLVIYGTGSVTTALSGSIGVLALGWSILEGLGAALVMPALVGLIAANYEGQRRAIAYGVIGGISGAAVAVGPIIGGWVTTNLTWRVVFVAEAVIVAAILAVVRLIGAPPQGASRPRLDLIGAAISAAGLGMIVIGVLNGSTWGFLANRNSPIAPFGLSLTPFVVAGGFGALMLFASLQRRREEQQKDPLVRLSLLSNLSLTAGLITLLLQQLVLMGTFFVIPLYLQIVLGKNAFDTGIKLLPVSVTLLIASLAGARLNSRIAPRRIVRCGLVILLVGLIALLWTINASLRGVGFAVALGVIGAGIGLLASQLGNILQSSVGEAERGEVGGLQYTAQNLGSSLGTALIGAVVIAALATAFLNQISENPAVSAEVQNQVGVRLESGLEFVSVDSVDAAAAEAGLPADETEAIVDGYSRAQIAALKVGLLVAALIALAALAFTRSLPVELAVSEVADAEDAPP